VETGGTRNLAIDTKRTDQGGVEHLNWVGPFTVDELLGSSFGSRCPQPPEANGVYLVSRRAWNATPTNACVPLFAGSNSRNPERFRLRIGHLIADMFGFFGAEGGNSSGGQSLHAYCKRNGINPKELHIGWTSNPGCARCGHNRIYDQLHPLLNKRRPDQCQEH
jgi:hypothetical protein